MRTAILVWLIATSTTILSLVLALVGEEEPVAADDGHGCAAEDERHLRQRDAARADHLTAVLSLCDDYLASIHGRARKQSARPHHTGTV